MAAYFIFMLLLLSIFHQVSFGNHVLLGMQKHSSGPSWNPSSGPIYTRWNDGCMDAGWQLDNSSLKLFPNKNCSNKTHTNWLLMSNGKIVTLYENTCQCLDCVWVKGHCYLHAINCQNVDLKKGAYMVKGKPYTGKEVKKTCHNFNIRIDPSQVDFKNKRFSFSIFSNSYPNFCLSII